jgi:hypothetical protein
MSSFDEFPDTVAIRGGVAALATGHYVRSYCSLHSEGAEDADKLVCGYMAGITKNHDADDAVTLAYYEACLTG